MSHCYKACIVTKLARLHSWITAGLKHCISCHGWRVSLDTVHRFLAACQIISVETTHGAIHWNSNWEPCLVRPDVWSVGQQARPLTYTVCTSTKVTVCPCSHGAQLAMVRPVCVCGSSTDTEHKTCPGWPFLNQSLALVNFSSNTMDGKAFSLWHHNGPL